jgi:hypothetical protein
MSNKIIIIMGMIGVMSLAGCSSNQSKHLSSAAQADKQWINAMADPLPVPSVQGSDVGGSTDKGQVTVSKPLDAVALPPPLNISVSHAATDIGSVSISDNRAQTDIKSDNQLQTDVKTHSEQDEPTTFASSPTESESVSLSSNAQEDAPSVHKQHVRYKDQICFKQRNMTWRIWHDCMVSYGLAR